MNLRIIRSPNYESPSASRFPAVLTAGGKPIIHVRQNQYDFLNKAIEDWVKGSDVDRAVFLNQGRGTGDRLPWGRIARTGENLVCKRKGPGAELMQDAE